MGAAKRCRRQSALRCGLGGSHYASPAGTVDSLCELLSYPQKYNDIRSRGFSSHTGIVSHVSIRYAVIEVFAVPFLAQGRSYARVQAGRVRPHAPGQSVRGTFWGRPRHKDARLTALTSNSTLWVQPTPSKGQPWIPSRVARPLRALGKEPDIPIFEKAGHF
jgi:hypothetical protein